MSAKRSTARVRIFALWAAAALVISLVAWPGAATAQDSPIKQAAQGRLGMPQLPVGNGITRRIPSFSGGLLDAAQGVLGKDAPAAGAGPSATAPIPDNSLGCSNRTSGGATRVNQDCTYRRQAEELIKINPTNSRNLIAGQNDSRVGFNKCGFDYSLDAGKTWGDGLPPFYQRLNSPPAGPPWRAARARCTPTTPAATRRWPSTRKATPSLAAWCST